MHSEKAYHPMLQEIWEQSSTQSSTKTEVSGIFLIEYFGGTWIILLLASKDGSVTTLSRGRPARLSLEKEDRNTALEAIIRGLEQEQRFPPPDREMRAQLEAQVQDDQWLREVADRALRYKLGSNFPSHGVVYLNVSVPGVHLTMESAHQMFPEPTLVKWLDWDEMKELVDSPQYQNMLPKT